MKLAYLLTRVNHCRDEGGSPGERDVVVWCPGTLSVEIHNFLQLMACSL